MAFIGQSFKIPFANSGLNGNSNIDLIDPFSFVDCRNLNLHNGVPEARKGTAHITGQSATLGASLQVMGAGYFKFISGVERIIVATSDGKLYHDADNYAAAIKTGLGTSKYTTFTYYRDKVYICNGNDLPLIYNGTDVTTNVFDNPAADWSVGNYPTHMIVHGKFNSERLWAYGVAAYKNKVYASGNGNDDFDASNVIATIISAESGDGITAAVEFADQLILFSPHKSYIYNDESYFTANWGYTASPVEGGSIHNRLTVRTPNDIVCMMDDGEIYSITAAQSYGDYKSASLTRPSFIHKYVQDNYDLTQINKFHAIYDPIKKAIYFFMVRKLQTQVDSALVYFIDVGKWSRLENIFYVSGYTASISFLCQKSTANWKVYTGDYAGWIWEIETSTYNDNNNVYYKGFTLPYTNFQNSRLKKKYCRGWLTLLPESNETIKVNLQIENRSIAGEEFIVGANVAGEEEFYLVDSDGNFVVGTESSNSPWSATVSAGSTYFDNFYNINVVGKRIQTEIYNDIINEGFKVEQLIYDFVPLGAMF